MSVAAKLGYETGSEGGSSNSSGDEDRPRTRKFYVNDPTEIKCKTCNATTRRTIRSRPEQKSMRTTYYKGCTLTAQERAGFESNFDRERVTDCTPFAAGTAKLWIDQEYGKQHGINLLETFQKTEEYRWQIHTKALRIMEDEALPRDDESCAKDLEMRKFLNRFEAKTARAESK